MPIFTVLHLSDLHINKNEDPGRGQLRAQLISDVKKVTAERHIKVDAIAMTGDIVDRGGTPEAYAMGEAFFRELAAALDVSRDQFLVVPGNHDIPRRTIDRSVLSTLTPELLTDAREASEHWAALQPRFNSFEAIRANLGGGQNRIPGWFGAAVQTVSTEQGQLRALLLNSSWSTVGDDDYGRLRVGLWQLEKLHELIRELPPADLNLALVHHPLDWLEQPERALLIDYLTDGHRLPVEAILHGHIHTGTVEMSANPDGALLSLVSGVGYPDASQRERGREKMSSCRYALYQFDTVAKTVDVCLRVSTAGGSFAADTLLYKSGSETGCFTMPYALNAPIPKEPSNPNRNQADPVPLISDWVGRTAELSALLDPRVRVAAITAIGGQGKTGLASEFLRRYGQGRDTRYQRSLWADCREVPHSLHVKVMEVLEALTDGKESVELFQHEHIDDTAKRFLGHLRRTPTLIVFDNVDSYVRADTEAPSAELLPFFNAALRTEHQSLVIFTCRPPIADSDAGFKHIALTGLSPQEGVEFFRKRLGDLTGPNGPQYCTTLVELTNGHPWWLGLIAGQVSSNQDTLKRCAERLSQGDHTWNERVSAYFQGIWNQLNRRAQSILRYLIEAPRPLTDFELSQAITDLGPVKIAKEIRKLLRLGLVELHETSQHAHTQYQVHPLARQFVHSSYKRDAQRPYVAKILHVFLPRWVVDKLSSPNIEVENLSLPTQPLNDLADSIETCLQSRNAEWALQLLQHYGDTLYNGGLHHRFQSLAARTLDTVDWKETHLAEQSWGQTFLSEVIDQLSVAGSGRSQHYLRRFGTMLEPETVGYHKYLTLAAHIAWQEERSVAALNLLDEYDSLAEKLHSQDSLKDPAYTRALALRDSGAYAEALELFTGRRKDSGGNRPTAADLGNAARCLLKLGRFDEAETLLAECLIQLRRENTHLAATNSGYAYLWIAEVLLSQGLRTDARAFLLLARHTWTEYAPGLLRHLHDSATLLGLTESDESAAPLELAVQLERTFLDSGAWIKHKTRPSNTVASQG